jgi:hypothetical protein
MGFTSIVFENVNWIHLSQVRDQWLALVSAVMNLLVPQMTEFLD